MSNYGPIYRKTVRLVATSEPQSFLSQSEKNDRVSFAALQKSNHPDYLVTETWIMFDPLHYSHNSNYIENGPFSN